MSTTFPFFRANNVDSVTSAGHLVEEVLASVPRGGRVGEEDGSVGGKEGGGKGLGEGGAPSFPSPYGGRDLHGRRVVAPVLGMDRRVDVEWARRRSSGREAWASVRFDTKLRPSPLSILSSAAEAHAWGRASKVWAPAELGSTWEGAKVVGADGDAVVEDDLSGVQVESGEMWESILRGGAAMEKLILVGAEMRTVGILGKLPRYAPFLVHLDLTGAVGVSENDVTSVVCGCERLKTLHLARMRGWEFAHPTSNSHQTLSTLLHHPHLRSLSLSHSRLPVCDGLLLLELHARVKEGRKKATMAMQALGRRTGGGGRGGGGGEEDEEEDRAGEGGEKGGELGGWGEEGGFEKSPFCQYLDRDEALEAAVALFRAAEECAFAEREEEKYGGKGRRAKKEKAEEVEKGMTGGGDKARRRSTMLRGMGERSKEVMKRKIAGVRVEKLDVSGMGYSTPSLLTHLTSPFPALPPRASLFTDCGLVALCALCCNVKSLNLSQANALPIPSIVGRKWEIGERGGGGEGDSPHTITPPYPYLLPAQMADGITDDPISTPSLPHSTTSPPLAPFLDGMGSRGVGRGVGGVVGGGRRGGEGRKEWGKKEWGKEEVEREVERVVEVVEKEGRGRGEDAEIVVQELKEKEKVVCEGLLGLSDWGLRQGLKFVGFSLVKLNLSSCSWLSKEGLEAIGKECPRLEEVVLRNCSNVEDDGLRTMCSYSSLAAKTLTSIDLSGCDQIEMDGVQGAAHGCKKLTLLTLLRCKSISDADAHLIARALPRATVIFEPTHTYAHPAKSQIVPGFIFPPTEETIEASSALSTYKAAKKKKKKGKR